MRNRLFDPESQLMKTLTEITDCIFLSLFFFLCALPVISSGAALAALYDATYRGFRRGEKNSWKRFFRVFRENFRASLLPTLVFLPLLLALVRAVVSLWNAAAAGGMSWTLFSALTLLCVLGLGILSVLFPLLSRFENPFFALLKNTLLLSLANLPRTLALGLLNALALFVCLRFVIPVFFLPALAALLGSLLIEPMFRPFMPEDGEESDDSSEE